MGDHDGGAGQRSAELFARASAVAPGGVNSPVRAFGAVGGTPVVMASGHGPYLTDVDGREYVDLICSWGPMILGHTHPDVIGAVRHALAQGTSFGTVTPGEVELAEETDRARPGGQGPPGQLGNRGHDDRAAPGPGLHRAAGRGQVRGLLPRPRGRAAGRGRVGRGHVRAARLARRDRGRPPPTRWCCRTTTRTRCARRSPPGRTRSPA